MHVFLLAIGVIVVLAIGTGWLFCAQGWKALASSYEDEVSSMAAIDEVRVTGGTVEVTVRTWTAPGFHIHRTARYLDPRHGRPSETHRVEGTALVLGGDDATMSIIEYVVDVPAGVRVTADVKTGFVNLAGVSTVDARVGTGSVTVTDARGDVAAEVGTGAVAVALVAPGDVAATTGMGSVDVTVPPDAYRVEAASGMGEVKVGIPSDPAAPHRLTLHSKMGRVSVAAR